MFNLMLHSTRVETQSGEKDNEKLRKHQIWRGWLLVATKDTQVVSSFIQYSSTRNPLFRIYYKILKKHQDCISHAIINTKRLFVYRSTTRPITDTRICLSAFSKTDTCYW